MLYMYKYEWSYHAIILAVTVYIAMYYVIIWSVGKIMYVLLAISLADHPFHRRLSSFIAFDKNLTIKGKKSWFVSIFCASFSSTMSANIAMTVRKVFSSLTSRYCSDTSTTLWLRSFSVWSSAWAILCNIDKLYFMILCSSIWKRIQQQILWKLNLAKF